MEIPQNSTFHQHATLAEHTKNQLGTVTQHTLAKNCHKGLVSCLKRHIAHIVKGIYQHQGWKLVPTAKCWWICSTYQPHWRVNKSSVKHRLGTWRWRKTNNGESCDWFVYEETSQKMFCSVWRQHTSDGNMRTNLFFVQSAQLIKCNFHLQFWNPPATVAGGQKSEFPTMTCTHYTHYTHILTY